MSQPSPSAAQQALWKFSDATQGQLFGAVALGVANLVGVLVLSGYAANPSIRYQLMNSSLSFIPGILPALQVSSPAPGPYVHLADLKHCEPASSCLFVVIARAKLLSPAILYAPAEAC